MSEAFIVRRGGIGSSGGTLVVTSSGAGTVTVSNSTLGKSYSKSVTAGGSVVFKGLKTGEWTVTLSNGAQTTVRSVTINADYSVSIAYFAATISVTYPAYSTCTCQNGSTTLTDTNTGADAKTVTFTVPNTGTWTVTATATDGSGQSKSTTVSITADGQSQSVTLSYELVLFNNGNDNTSVTGGWRSEHFYASEQSFTINNNSINLYIYNNDGSGGIEASTNNRISLSNYKTLNVNVSNISNGTCYLGVSSNQNISASNNYTALNSGTTPGTYTIDISSISDSLYIKLKIISNHSKGASMAISKVWLG